MLKTLQSARDFSRVHASILYDVYVRTCMYDYVCTCVIHIPSGVFSV